MAIGNLTAQAGSNLNLNYLDHLISENLGFPNYVRYVDDAIIIHNNRQELFALLENIELELAKIHQSINKKKTKIDTAYHGVQFLGKITYPYGYQKPTKEVIKRTINNVKSFNPNEENYRERINSEIGMLKNYNCRKLIENINNISLKQTHIQKIWVLFLSIFNISIRG